MYLDCGKSTLMVWQRIDYRSDLFHRDSLAGRTDETVWTQLLCRGFNHYSQWAECIVAAEEAPLQTQTHTHTHTVLNLYTHRQFGQNSLRQKSLFHIRSSAFIRRCVSDCLTVYKYMLCVLHLLSSVCSLHTVLLHHNIILIIWMLPSSLSCPVAMVTSVINIKMLLLTCIYHITVFTFSTALTKSSMHMSRRYCMVTLDLDPFCWSDCHSEYCDIWSEKKRQTGSVYFRLLACVWKQERDDKEK